MRAQPTQLGHTPPTVIELSDQSDYHQLQPGLALAWPDPPTTLLVRTNSTGVPTGSTGLVTMRISLVFELKSLFNR